MAPETMSISVNGQSKVPPGFRFHPTEEELLLYYLRKKVSFENIDLDVIQDVDLNKLEPWDIQEKCKIGSTPQNDWYFFSHKDKKYPTGTRTNRATISGFWKATGRDKVIYSNSRKIGMRKTLVFYRGRAPHGLKSDWIMHEYRLDDDRNSNASLTSLVVTDALGETTLEEAGWVVCRVFRKKNHYKNHLDDVSHITMSTNTISETEIPVMLNPSNEGTLEQMLEYMERNCKERGSGTPFLSSIDNKFMQLPSLESPRNSTTSGQTCYQPFHLLQMINSQVTGDPNSFFSNLGDLDQLVASHLNDQNETPKLQACFSDTNIICCDQNPSPATIHDLQTQRLQSLSSPSSSTNRTYHCHQDYSNEFDLWSFERPL